MRRLDEKIAKWEKQVGVSPCLEVAPGVFKGNYTLQISDFPTPDPESHQGSIIGYTHFWDALVMGLKIFRETGNQVSLDGNDKSNISIVIRPGRENILV